MGKTQYAWKQTGKKSAWFSDKKMCLMHCNQHKVSQEPVYLYKRILVVHGSLPFILKTQYQDFCWKVKAYNTFRQHESEWTLIKSPWFDNVKECLRDFKGMKGYDVADCWGTQHYLMMRRRLVERRTLEMEESFLLSLSRGGGRDQEEWLCNFWNV